jgi:hypothetical protein
VGVARALRPLAPIREGRPLPPPWICLMSHAGGGRGRGSLHCGAHRASGRGAGRSHEMVGFLFASAGFTQFSLGCFVRLSGVHAVFFWFVSSFVFFFGRDPPLGSGPPLPPPRGRCVAVPTTCTHARSLFSAALGSRGAVEDVLAAVGIHNKRRYSSSIAIFCSCCVCPRSLMMHERARGCVFAAAGPSGPGVQ